MGTSIATATPQAWDLVELSTRAQRHILPIDASRLITIIGKRSEARLLEGPQQQLEKLRWAGIESFDSGEWLVG